MGINPLACLSFGGKKSGKKSSAKKLEPAAAAVAASEAKTEANLSVGPKRAEAAAGKRRRGARGGGGKAEAAPYRGGFMPYRPLHSYNIDPVANAMYFYGSVGQIMC